MKKLLIMTASLMAAMVSFAEAMTWHVEKTGDDTAAADDKTGATAFRTIKAAIDKSSNGDTIVIGDGEWGEADEGVNGDGTTGRCRVNVSKSLVLKSRNGADKTAIVGAFHSAESPLGETAVRCISVKSENGGQTVLENLTFKNGATSSVTTAPGRSGGIYGYGGTVYVIGCVVSNCYSYNYACYNVNMLGCRIEDCVASANAITLQGNASSTKYVAFTVFARNVAKGTSMSVVRGSKIDLVNCTFVGNDAGTDAFASNSYTSRVCNCLFSLSASASVAAHANMTVENSLLDSDGGYPLIAPHGGDLRPRAGGPADGTGVTTCLDRIVLPTGYTFDDIRDPYGNPIDAESLHLGAVQSAGIAAGGGMYVKKGIRIDDGEPFPRDVYFFPTNYPVQYKVEAALADGEKLFGYSITPRTPSWRFPQPGQNAIYVVPSPDTAAVTTNDFTLAKTEIWVSPGEAGTGSGTFDDPYGTINDAIDKVTSSTRPVLIYAKKGVYSKGARGANGGARDYDYGYCIADLWSRQARLIGVEGAENTFIVGAPDPDTKGIGEKAVKCVMFQGTAGAAVQGFTLTGGWTMANVSGALGKAGGGVHGIGGHCSVTDCIISNNTGYTGAAITGVLAERCLICGNSAPDGAIAYGSGTSLSACVLRDNVCSTAGFLGANVTAVQCSLVGNRTTDYLMANADTIKVFNSILQGCQSTVSKPVLSGCVFWDFGSFGDRDGYVKADPYFISPAAGDLRVLANSPAFAAAEIPAAENYGASWFALASTDFTGERIRFTDGRPVAGAFNAAVPGAVIAADKGGLAIEGGTIGVNAIEGGSVVSVSGSGIAERPCAGVVVNSVTNFFDDLPDGALELTAELAEKGLSVTALYTGDWYVNADATVGDDSHSGFTPKNAKRTLEKAMEGPVAGDTVHAAAGTYASGEMTFTASSVDYHARVVVPEGVRLVGAGSDRTVIEGRSSASAEEGWQGCGPGALRCAYLGRGASLERFTLCKGRTDHFVEGDKGLKDFNQNHGGGVSTLPEYTSSTVRDCVISDCVAVRGGGAAFSTLVNCRVTGNRVLDGAAATYYGQAYGTVFAANVGSNYTVMYPGTLENCTVFDGRLTSKTSYDVYINSTACLLKNCVFACTTYANIKNSAPLDTPATHCVFANDIGNCLSGANVDETCVLTNLAAIVLDADGRPVVGSGNPAIDAADESQFDVGLCGDLDASGFQRVMNAAMDIGALEGDWRETYARAIGNRRVTVTAASPDVKLNADGKVELSDGDEVALDWNHRIAGRRTITATVADGGTLKVSNGDTTVTTFAGPVTDGTFAYEGEAGLESLSFAFSGDGASTFALDEDRTGLVLIVR